MEGYPAKRDWKRECKELETIVAQQAAVIEQMREALQLCRPHMYAHASNTQDEAFDNLCSAIALQPCPEVLNKVRADAVRVAAKWVGFTPDCNCNLHMKDYAQRIEKGEA